MTQLLSWAQSNQLFSLLVLLISVFTFRELILRKISHYQIVYYLTVFPGVILHEISHLFGCLITLTKVKQIKLFSLKGGFVIHEKPRIPYLGDLIISIAPLIIGLAVSYYLLGLIYFDNGILFKISSIIYIYFLLSVVLTMIPSTSDVNNSLPAYLAILIMAIAFNGKFNIPYFNDVSYMLLALVCLLISAYIILLFLGQKNILKIK